MTITIMRPSTVYQTNGVVTVVGTGSAANVTDDAPADDTSYITSYQFGASVFLNVTGITLSAGQRVRACKLRCRCFHNSADVGHQDQVDLRLRGPGKGPTPARTRGTYSNAAVEIDSGWWYTGPGGDVWTESNVDSLKADIAWRARTTTPPNITQLRVSEVYVDVDIRTPLAVSAVTATGTSSTSRPTISYTLTDVDGFGQVAAQFRVFRLDQTTAAGFSPDTTKAVWDSGQVNGDNVSAVVGVDLINTTQYKAYARAATGWSGPLGTLWWSPWAASSTFTMVLTPPPTPALTATMLYDSGVYRTVLSVDAPVNLLTETESSFEAGTGSWAVDANAAAPATSTTNPKSGTSSGTMSSSAAGAMRWVRTGLALVPGRTVTVGGSLRAATAGRSVRMLIRWKTSANALISTVTGSSVTDTTTGYTAATASGAAPANAATFDVVVEVLATAAAAEVHRLDEVFAYVGTPTTFSPGGLRPSSTVVIERGDRVDNRRGQAVNWVAEQIATGGSVLRTTEGFRTSDEVQDRLTWEPVDVAWPDTLEPGNPNGCIAWRPRSGAVSLLHIGRSSADVELTDRDLFPWQFPVVAGAAHVLSAVLWAKPTSYAPQLIIEWLDETITPISQSSSAILSVTTTPQRFSVTAAAPAGARYAWGIVKNQAADAVDDLFGSMFAFGAGSTVISDPPSGGPIEWITVREIQPATGFPVGERIMVNDHEIPPGRPVLYRARLLATLSSGDAIASNYSTSVSVIAPLPTLPIMLNPIRPERSWPVERQATDVSRKADTVDLHGEGRDGDPVRLTSWRGGEDGQLYIETIGSAETRRLRMLLDDATFLLLQHHDGGQTYLLPGEYTIAELSPRSDLFGFTIPYLECGRP